MAILEGSDGPLRELALFAGAGGGILGGLLLGWRTVCAVECDTYAASVLVARQNDGILGPFPVWDDVRTFDGREWEGRIDVVSGGFPCQDISSAGKGAGIDGERSGLWREMARIVSEVRPRFVFVENSPLLIQRGLAVVITDLAKLGYDARWGIISAQDAAFLDGDPCIYHKRERIWIVAYRTVATQGRREPSNEPSAVAKEYNQTVRDGCAWHDSASSSNATENRDRDGKNGSGRTGIDDVGESVHELRDTDGEGLEKRQGKSGDNGPQQPATERTSWWEAEPSMGRVVDGVACRMDRLAAIGNGQVSCVAALAWRTLTKHSR